MNPTRTLLTALLLATPHFRAHEYDALAGKYRYLTKLAHDASKKMLLPVHPGHDNSRFRDDPYVMPRCDGQTLHDFLRSATDAGQGRASITWRTKTESFEPHQSAAFDWPKKAGWQEIRVQLAEKSRIIHVRIHPPKGAAGIEIQSIELRGSGGEARAFRFDSKSADHP